MMSERLERTTPGEGEDEILGQLVDKLISRVKPDVAKAVRLCAIPRWFDEQILSWLWGEGREHSGRTREILTELINEPAMSVFVVFDRNHGYVYHKNVRNLLQSRWRKENVERFQELNGIAAAYYADKLQVTDSSEKQRAEWEREKMLHLLVADEERGIDLLANLLDRAGKSHSLPTYTRLLNRAREQLDDTSADNRPWLLFFEGELAHLYGDWETALKIWEALEEKREQLPGTLGKTVAYRLCFLYKDKGESDKAVKCLQDNLKILKKTGDERGMATTLNNLGFLSKDKGQWAEAEGHFQHSLRIVEKAGDECEMAVTLNNLGLLYKDREEWEKATEHFQRGLQVLEKAMVPILSNLGFLYKDRKRWEEARKYFQHSREILERVGDEYERATAFKDLGFLYTDKKDWERAKEYFESSLDALEKVKDVRGMANTYNYLGLLHTDEKDWEKAGGYFRRSMDISKSIDDKRGMATTFSHLGCLYRDKKEWEKASESFRSSLEIAKEIGEEMNAATTMYHFALLYEDMEQYDEAVELLTKVAKICERVGHPDLAIRNGSRALLEKIEKNVIRNQSLANSKAH